MGKYCMYIKRSKSHEYIQGEIDGIVRTLAKDSSRIDPWFDMEDDSDLIKRMDVSPEELGHIVYTVERLCPNVIQRIEFEES